MDCDPPTPMPANVFLHFLEKNTDAHEKATWTPRFPHKINDSFYCNAKALSNGWGIQIEEGRNWLLFCVMNLIVAF